MKIQIQGKGNVTLSKSDYVCEGGEGQIFVKGSTAYKIYLDSKKMIPTAKIQELSVLSHPNIVKPENIILNDKDVLIGYTMNYIKDTAALCQTFTKAFRDRNGIDHNMMLSLVRSLQEIVNHIHQHKILIVDLNELNFLVSNDFKSIYSIDVDSFQTKSFHATALMESVRDRHSKSFNEGTDWFSFAIVSFQMFIGIHPYKGKHPTIKTMDERMLKNISVMNNSVSVPAACYPTSVIPQSYQDWYRAILERGMRVAPPNDLTAVVNIIQQVKTVTGNKFDIQNFAQYDGEVLSIDSYNGYNVIVTSKSIIMGSDQTDSPASHPFVIATNHNTVLAAWIENRQLKVFNATTRHNIDVTIEAEMLLKSNGRLYVKSGALISELVYANDSIGGRNIIISVKTVANVMERATSVFDGVAFQNMLGACWASIFPKSGEHIQIRMKELDDYRIIDARYQNNVLMVTGVKNGVYDAFICRIDGTQYDLRVKHDITPSGLNFIVLDNGVTVYINENDDVEIFSNKKDSSVLNTIDDPNVAGDLKLFHIGTKVLIAKNNNVWSMTMKRS